MPFMSYLHEFQVLNQVKEANPANAVCADCKAKGLLSTPLIVVRFEPPHEKTINLHRRKQRH